MSEKAQTPEPEHTAARRPPSRRTGADTTHSEHQTRPAAVIQRALAAPRSLTADDVQYLQRTLGNGTTGQLLARGRENDPDAGPRPATEWPRPESVSGASAENRTGMPDSLKAGLEQLSGFDLAAVRVHYNSSDPARLNAFAYSQGTDIVVAPGQERHLPHEGWHVVQQMQGRVKPTIQAMGVSINDDEGLEREADLMGRKALEVREPSRATLFHTRIAAEGDAGGEDEPFTVAMMPGPLTISRRSVPLEPAARHVPVIQRAASFVAGPVNATTNIAAHIIAGNRDMGFTPPTLNGVTTLSTAGARGAINRPTLSGQSTATAEEAWIASVPTNVGSFTMQVPSSGPWSTATTNANVAALFTSLHFPVPAACAGAGNTTFSVHGQPTDAGFAGNVLTHENLHARDHQLGFVSVLIPWDVNVTIAQAARTVFRGPTLPDAEAALWAAMGGTPDQIADRQFNLWVTLNNITHRGTTVATGGTATPSNAVADPTCTTSSIDVT